MGRDGTWTVELVRPLKGGRGEVDAIVIQPVSADHMIRWDDERIPSFYALLADLSGTPERTLLGLSGVDLERVMFAFQTIMTARIRQDFEGRVRPMSTAYENEPHPQDLAPPEPRLPGAPPRDPEVEPFAGDRVDPRFPDIGGPVVQRADPSKSRLQPPPPRQPPPPGDGMGFAPPEAMERIG